MILVLGSENRPESLTKKGFYSKTAEMWQKIFHMVILRLMIPFSPYQPTFGRNEVFFVFFFLPKSCTFFS